MTDREMLELAAMAAGIDLKWTDSGKSYTGAVPFSPLTDDGDAMRLAVKLHITLEYYRSYLRTNHYPGGEWWLDGECVVSDVIEYTHDRLVDVRRAITMAAANIGKDMK